MLSMLNMPNSTVLTVSRPAKLLPWFHGLYYLISGVWPLLSITSFQLVTGEKTDLWLVKTVGLLLMISGCVLVVAAYRRRIHLEIVILAVGNAFVLSLIEVMYWAAGTISPIYLLDAVLEGLLIAGWLLMWQRLKKVMALHR